MSGKHDKIAAMKEFGLLRLPSEDERFPGRNKIPETEEKKTLNSETLGKLYELTNAGQWRLIVQDEFKALDRTTVVSYQLRGLVNQLNLLNDSRRQFPSLKDELTDRMIREAKEYLETALPTCEHPDITAVEMVESLSPPITSPEIELIYFAERWGFPEILTQMSIPSLSEEQRRHVITSITVPEKHKRLSLLNTSQMRPVDLNEDNR